MRNLGKGTEEYKDFIDTDRWPKYNANYEGSSEGMEVKGILEIFKRSVDLRGVRYLDYTADGGAKNHKAISAAKPVKKRIC